MVILLILGWAVSAARGHLRCSDQQPAKKSMSCFGLMDRGSNWWWAMTDQVIEHGEDWRSQVGGSPGVGYRTISSA